MKTVDKYGDPRDGVEYFHLRAAFEDWRDRHDAFNRSCLRLLISITDGQIYLSPTLFELGILPAGRVGACLADVGLPSAGAVTLLKEDETSDDKRSDPG